MARQFRAFVSYRRNDAFMRHPNNDGRPIATGFIENLKAALRQLGISDVFVDTSGIGGGDFYERRIFEAISDCDLFIALIGTGWLSLLEERIGNSEPDVLVHEIATAIQINKNIIPLLIDGAVMPTEAQLQADNRLAPLSKINAVSVRSNAPVETIVTALRDSVREALNVRRLGRGWATGYLLFSTLVWIFCSFVPNVKGLQEFGLEPWLGMATSWSGLFIWPLFFLPFVLRALYEPFKIIVEAILNSRSLQSALTYASPILAGIIIAVLATAVEISPPQVPWTIHPKLAAKCSGPSEFIPATEEYSQDKQVLAGYGAGGQFHEDYKAEFWMKDRCWPNVFFYLTNPVRDGYKSDEFAKQDRLETQKAFRRILAVDSKQFKGTEAPYSDLFYFYVLSVFLMISALIISILMSIVFAVAEIRRPQDGSALEAPKENAFLCLTYGFVTLLGWLPFRLITDGIKLSYYCLDPSGCGPIWETYIKDGALFCALLMGYTALTVRLVWKYGRLTVTFFGLLVVFVIGACIAAVTTHNQQASQLVDFWQFWIAVSCLGSIMLIALWYKFDPAVVRLRDFESLANSAVPTNDRISR